MLECLSARQSRQLEPTTIVVMRQSTIPMIVVTARQDDVELINRTLRDAGHPAHCHWVQQADKLADAIEATDPHLLWFFSDRSRAGVREVAKIKQQSGRIAPLIVVAPVAEESAICDALLSGAQDLVSVAQRERMLAVAERELRTFRLERALDDTLRSANQYKKQLKSFMAGSVDAIAHIQEGIVVEANQAWTELFGFTSPEEALAPLMDCVEAGSHVALKGALAACSKGRWDAEPLKITALTADGTALPLKLALESTLFDGERAVKVTVPRETAPPQEPGQLVDRVVHTDPATGFYHRRRFVELLTDRLDTNARSGVRALAYIRPDKFGEIEDEVGPLASEDILIQLAEILRGLTHEHDLYGRFGGNVFAILLERGTIRDIEAWSEHVLSRVSEHIFEVAHNTLSITVTIGLAEIGPGTDRVEGLIGDAERANQRGRKRGGNQVVLEETSDESTRIQRFDALWVQQIKAALVENRFRLVHMQIRNLAGDSEVLYDTVVRMIDAQGDEAPAAEFMAAAGRNRLLRAIDRWIIGATLNFAASQEFDRAFVKLSHESIIDKTLLDWIVQQTRARGVTPSRLCFQITEDDATQYLKQTTALAEELKAAGFYFAVEHFGIGRDPMRILNQTPMQYLKIDGSLMQSLATDQLLQEKVRGFIRSADKRKILTIAERVENANTMAVLFQLGVTYIQGHYLHEPEVVLEERPMPQAAAPS
jgi:multidomain signaling protein FimX